MAEDKLDYLSSDPLTRELYKAREYTEHESASRYTLELYAVKFLEQSGRLSNDLEKIGKAFELILE